MSKTADLSGIEQSVIYSIQVFISASKLYLSPLKPPFSITQYTPLYYYIVGYTARLADNNGADIRNLYIIGRSWNLVFNILSALIVFNIGRRRLLLSKNKAYFLFLLSFSFNSYYHFAVRPDSLCDLFGIAALDCFMIFNGLSKNGFKSMLLLAFTVFLTSCAIFSKQNGIQLFFMISAFCLLNRQYKTLFKIFILAIIFYGLFTYYFYTKENAFLNNIIGGVNNGISFGEFEYYILFTNRFIIICLPLVVASFYFILKTNARFSTYNQNEQFLLVCLLCSLLFATATALKLGSRFNYYIFFMDISVLFIFNMIDKKELLVKLKNIFSLNGLLYLYFMFTIIFNGISTFNYIKFLNGIYPQQSLAVSRVTSFIKKDLPRGKYILVNLLASQNIPSRQSINNIFYKNCLAPQLDILQNSSGPSKIFGYHNLEGLIRKGEVAYIIEPETKPSFQIFNNQDTILSANFVLVKDIEGYDIYKCKYKK